MSQSRKRDVSRQIKKVDFHTKGGFIGGFLFRINVKKVKPFAQPVLGLSPNAISCYVIEYADECILIAIL